MDQFDRWPRSLRSLHSTWRCPLQGGPLHDVLPIYIQQTHWSYPISRMARSHITLMINSSATFCFTKQNKAQSLTKTLPGTNSVHLKIGLNAPKRKIIFQPLFFAGVLVSGGSTCHLLKVLTKHQPPHLTVGGAPLDCFAPQQWQNPHPTEGAFGPS